MARHTTAIKIFQSATRDEVEDEFNEFINGDECFELKNWKFSTTRTGGSASYGKHISYAIALEYYRPNSTD